MESTSHITEALRSLMTGSPFSSDVRVTDQDIDNLISAGLGPIFYHVLQSSGNLSEIDKGRKLKASDITSRALSAELFKNVERVIGLLQTVDIDPVLLKGASYATAYYPEPHQRIMGDVDILLSPDRMDEAEKMLLEDGFTKANPAPGVNYETHIHGAPLFHPDRNLWIELHRRLLMSEYAASEETPLNLSTMNEEIESVRLGSLEVKRFRAEFELMYLAAGWCRDMTHSFGRPGMQRSLVDCSLILRAGQQHLDWDTVLHWSNDTLSGACLYILLSFLKRTGVFKDASNVCEVLGKQQRFVNAMTLQLMHNRIESHLVRFNAYGRLASRATTSNMFDVLVRKEAAWKNLAAVPGNILFPRRETRRFELSYQISRLRNALGRDR